jgi:hypothetical protein
MYGLQLKTLLIWEHWWNTELGGADGRHGQLGLKRRQRGDRRPGLAGGGRGPAGVRAVRTAAIAHAVGLQRRDGGRQHRPAGARCYALHACDWEISSIIWCMSLHSANALWGAPCILLMCQALTLLARAMQGMAQLMAMQGRGALGNSADAALGGSSYASAGGVPHAGSTGALSDDLQFGPGTLPQGAPPALQLLPLCSSMTLCFEATHPQLGIYKTLPSGCSLYSPDMEILT